MDDLTGAVGRTSGHGVQEGQCVEVADGFPGRVPIRDGKGPEGPAPVLPADAWSAFVSAVRSGEFGAV
ncbi:DUF397 domain-containing protein [Kitasatospora sp. NPDC089797]|uniref:DUF397 domain-containing protein n=1 Tax=Kitasatospora sp. NPDC089797 TaxID=3155298 RepID=UPI00342896A6